MSTGGTRRFDRLAPNLVAVAAISLAKVALAAEPVQVENDDHRVEIVRAERHDELMDGLLRPEDPAEAFLLVFLRTDDPCLDPERIDGCFDDEVEADERLAWACGSVVLEDGQERLADGGGILDGELACSYVVPRRSKRLRLMLRGYPEIELEPALSAAE
ncbi:MAG: hypothetical protein R3244_02385 [Thermoanaerobaculia bacterium]|nr:hypothetical protein [Thermoanaerobaculia bacterium]